MAVTAGWAIGLLLSEAALAQTTVFTTVTSQDQQHPTSSCGRLLDDAGIFESVEVCSVYVELSGVADTLLSVGFSDVSATTSDDLIQVPSGLGGSDSAPLQADVDAMPYLACDSFVTLGRRAIPDGETDCTALDPDFDSASFNETGQALGGWYCNDPSTGQGQPDEQKAVLIAQFTYRFGSNVSGTVTAFTSPGAVPVVANFECPSSAIPCAEASDCADMDTNGIRDDACVWWACENNACIPTDIGYADLGGPNGACPPDGTADANDRFHALNCFSNADTLGGVGYPCETSPPAAYNVDAAGLGAPCTPDGVCDGNDAFAALNAFSGTATCTCSPSPEPPAPQILDRTELELLADHGRVRPGQLVEIDAFLKRPLQDLRGYQLHLQASGGITGELELVDVVVQPRKNHVFDGLQQWQAFNTQTGQVLVGLDSPGVIAQGDSYLATFVFKASADASGEFTVEILKDRSNPAHRTVLFPTRPNGAIDIQSAAAASVTVDAGLRLSEKR